MRNVVVDVDVLWQRCLLFHYGCLRRETNVNQKHGHCMHAVRDLQLQQEQGPPLRSHETSPFRLLHFLPHFVLHSSNGAYTPIHQGCIHLRDTSARLKHFERLLPARDSMTFRFGGSFEGSDWVLGGNWLMCVSAEKAEVEGLGEGLSEERGLLRGGIWISGWDLDSAFASGVSSFRFLESRSIVSWMREETSLFAFSYGATSLALLT